LDSKAMSVENGSSHTRESLIRLSFNEHDGCDEQGHGKSNVDNEERVGQE
jgi:hypothetical protein